MAQIGFKVAYNGVTRFVNNPTSWDELGERIRTSHSIPANSAIAITYVDEDGDKITIDTNPEFEELLNYAQSSGVKSVKIEVVASAAGNASAAAGQQSKDAFIMVVEGARQGVERMVLSAPEPTPTSVIDESAARKLAEEQEAAARKLAEEQEAAARKLAEEQESARQRAYEEAEAARKRAEEEVEAAYQAFLTNLQPQVDTVLSLIESAPPSFIPRLLRDLGPSLASRSWGITVENALGQALGSTNPGTTQGEEPRCGRRGRHGGRHEHGRWMRQQADPDFEKKWWGVTCDGCGKSEWAGTRWRCQHQACTDYDLCDECHNSRRDELHPDVTHEFLAIPQPDAFWNRVTCDVCGKKGLTDRFKCQSCDDFDMCASCHSRATTIHDSTHAFTAMGSPATHTASAMAQISAVLDLPSLPADQRARTERAARHHLNRTQGDVSRVIDHMLRHRARHNPPAGGSSSSSSDEADAGHGHQGSPFWGPHRGFHRHRGPHPHPYHARGPWGAFPAPPPPPPGSAPPPPPGHPGSEGMPPHPPAGPWGPGGPGMGPFGWWGPRGWF